MNMITWPSVTIERSQGCGGVRGTEASSVAAGLGSASLAASGHGGGSAECEVKHTDACAHSPVVITGSASQRGRGVESFLKLSAFDILDQSSSHSRCQGRARRACVVVSLHPVANKDKTEQNRNFTLSL